MILIQDRNGELHLSDYSHYERKVCLCGKIYNKRDHINALAIDNVIDELCSICYWVYDEIRNDVSAYLIEPKAKKQYHRIQIGYNTQVKYETLLIGRHWRKLQKYRLKHSPRK